MCNSINAPATELARTVGALAVGALIAAPLAGVLIVAESIRRRLGECFFVGLLHA